MDKKEVKKIADKEVKKHEKHDHPGKPATKFAAGGVTSKSMMQHGRGMAKVMNQRNTGSGG